METNELEILISTIKEEALRIDRKWIFKGENFMSIVAVDGKLTEELLQPNGGLISDIAKLIPLESENSELIASILSEVSEEPLFSFTFFLLVRYLFSMGKTNKLHYYVDEIPIIWNQVESGEAVNRSGT